jgi:isocitrate/isopropylmalate dehydrogenase
MRAVEIIEEIKRLPRAEQSRVIQFAFELARARQLPGEKLSELAQRMVESDDPAEVERLKVEITRGFYGE